MPMLTRNSLAATGMSRLLIVGLVCGTLVGVPLGAGAAEQAVMDREAALQAANLPGVQVQVAQLRERVASEGGSLDPGTVDGLLQASGLGSVGRERLLYELVMVLRQVEPSPELRSYVSSLASYREQTQVWHAEGPLPVPLFGIAAAAGGTLRVWDRKQMQLDTRQRLAEKSGVSFAVFESSGPGNHAAREGMLDALRTAQGQELEGLKNQLLASYPEVAGLQDPLAIVAQRTADAEVYLLLFDYGQGPTVARLVRSVRQVFEPDQAFALLRGAADHPRLSSMALYQMAPLASAESRVGDYLLEQLHDPATGGSAAAVIARADQPALLLRVAEVLEQPELDRTTAARAVLALRLHDSTVSRNLLRHALEQGSIADSHLEREVRQWLDE